MQLSQIYLAIVNSTLYLWQFKTEGLLSVSNCLAFIQCATVIIVLLLLYVLQSVELVIVIIQSCLFFYIGSRKS